MKWLTFFRLRKRGVPGASHLQQLGQLIEGQAQLRQVLLLLHHRSRHAHELDYPDQDHLARVAEHVVGLKARVLFLVSRRLQLGSQLDRPC